MTSQHLVQKLWNYCTVLRDEALERSADLPAPEAIAAEIVEDLRAALAEFEQLEAALGAPAGAAAGAR